MSMLSYLGRLLLQIEIAGINAAADSVSDYRDVPVWLQATARAYLNEKALVAEWRLHSREGV